VLVVEGTIALPDGEDQMEKLAHAVAHRDVAACAFGLETTIEGTDGGVQLSFCQDTQASPQLQK
jgi:hypothetical protein